MSRSRFLCTLLLVALGASACRSGSAARAWRSPVQRDHPLVGRIWDVRAGAFVDEPALTGELARARYALLGEKHDNLDHHVLQARLVAAMTAAGRRPAVAFEMLTPSQAPALARHLAARPRDAAGLGDAVRWKDSGWPEWPMYEPIAQAAVSAGLPILVANLDNDRMRTVMREGLAALDPAFVARFGLETPLPAEAEATMTEDISASHCGHAPASLVSKLITAQRARDAHMAQALLATPGDGAVLISGSGHARTDFGVPAYLRRAEPAARVVSVGFLEAEQGHPTPADYAAHFKGRLPFDYVWFTPAVDDEDPCEKFKQSLERMQRPR